LNLTSKKNYEVGDVVLVRTRWGWEPDVIIAAVQKDGNPDDEYYQVDEMEGFFQHSQIAGMLEGFDPATYRRPLSDARTAQAVIAEGQGGPCEGSVYHSDSQVTGVGGLSPSSQGEVPKTDTEKSTD
jgi:hypothetical protein